MSESGHRKGQAIIVQYSDSSSAYYAYAEGIEDDIIISSRYCPSNEDLLGKWIHLAIDDRSYACDTIQVIDDVFETKVFRGQVEVKINIQFDGRTARGMGMFYNDYFGYICDPNNVLHNTRDGANHNNVWVVRRNAEGLNSRWKVSSEQDDIQHIFPRPENVDKLETVVGVITTHAKLGDFYLVWSPSRPRSTICIAYKFCPSKSNLLGTWAEMRVNRSQRVQRPISVIDALYETRTIFGMTEFRIDFQQTRRFNPDYHLFYHEYFGGILDTLCIIDDVKEGGWYNGWIVYSQHSDASTYWRLAMKQTVLGPYNSPYSCLSPLQQDNNFNEPRNMDPNPPYRTRDRSRSMDRSTRHATRRVDEFTHKRRSPSPEVINVYKEPSRSHANELYDSQKNQYTSHEGHSTSSPTAENRQCHRSRSPEQSNFRPSQTVPGLSSMEQRKAHENVDWGPHRTKNVPPIRSATETPETDHRQDDQSVASTSALYLLDSPGPDPSPKLHLTSEEKELKKLKTKLSRICKLSLSFTANDSVSTPMQLHSLEEYEELIKLTNKFQ
ncbi:MABP domain-containing protein [Caenorhabditis elegans]|uniref:MABP domain-containing protein n=1 Tax=Caenorhabditis elegans TaxID=6239 RepID=Q17414_CAEEL|nr:MABP domain-containing protein [Caenorhabditis elegans]CAA93454.4 MABP domain-containing protein [Caenorhabditis elegans]|eukprot:NP_502306.1 Uncharacterized protein CELE_B0001.5 [Caenorhabditis elegans]